MLGNGQIVPYREKLDTYTELPVMVMICLKAVK